MEQMQNNCPNCGSAITTEKCPYCGTLFYDFAAMDTDKPFYIKIKDNNRIIRCKVNLLDFHKRVTASDETFYADNHEYCVISSVHPTIELMMEIIPDENGLLSVIVDTTKVPKEVNNWIPEKLQ